MCEPWAIFMLDIPSMLPMVPPETGTVLLPPAADKRSCFRCDRNRLAFRAAAALRWAAASLAVATAVESIAVAGGWTVIAWESGTLAMPDRAASRFASLTAPFVEFVRL